MLRDGRYWVEYQSVMYTWTLANLSRHKSCSHRARLSRVLPSEENQKESKGEARDDKKNTSNR